jgi:hypothetical protein
VYRLANNGDVAAFKMGHRQGGPSRTGPKGAYLNRYVTDEQRSRRPIFNATLRAGASWLFFRVARSARMTQIWALRSRLEKQPTDRRRSHHYLRDGALEEMSMSGRVSRRTVTTGQCLLSCVSEIYLSLASPHFSGS